MKRHIYVLALFTLLFSGCLIDTAETSNIDFLDEAVDNELLDRLVFPMVMAETAFLINVYEGMSAEEKLEMGYVYRALLKEAEGKYTMNNFHGFTLETGGKTLDEPGAEWYLTAFNRFAYYNTSETRFVLSRSESGYSLVCQYDKNDPYEICFRSVEDEEAFFSWEIDFQCTYKTDEGRTVSMTADAPIVRKVYRKGVKDEGCSLIMDGTVTVDIKDHDVVPRVFEGQVVPNHYDF